MITVENPTSQVDAAGNALPYWLDDADRAWIAQAASEPNTENLPEIQVWPFEDPTNFGQPTLRGRCPLCGLVHEHGLGGGYVRLPHCSIQLPPFDMGRPKPDAYMLRPECSPAPEAIAKASTLAAKRVDLLQTLVRFPRTKTMVTLVGAKARKRPWNRADFGVAVEALWSSGVCDERAAIMEVDGNTGATSAWGNVAAWGDSVAGEVQRWFGVDLSSAGEGIVVPLSSGLQTEWASVADWFGGAVNGLVNFIPEWARGPLGIQVTGQPMSEADIASRARQEGQAAADRVPGAWMWDSQENKDSADQAKALAFLQAEGAALSRLRAENAQSNGPGAALNALAASLAAPSAVPVETPTVTAGTVTTQSLTVPEPLLVHQPQAVDASYHADALTITVPPHMTAQQAESMILSVLAQHSKAHAERVSAAMGMMH